MNAPEWVGRTSAVSDVRIEVGFVIHETFFIGNENDVDQLDDPAFRVPLRQPKSERFGQFVLTEAAAGSMAEMIAYYRDLFRLAKNHGRVVRRADPYFWMRPVIVRPNGFVVNCPWYDTFEEATRFLEAIGVEKVGEIYDDRDQCWELTIWSDSESMFVREWDPDYEVDHTLASFPCKNIQAQVRPLLERITSIIDQLESAIGSNYWTRK